MKPYRACSCRDPETGRLLGKQCPELQKNSKHGKWYARYEAPRSADGKRRQPRIGPYNRKDDVVAALLKIMDRKRAGGRVDDRAKTLGEYLDERLTWRRSEGELKPSTLESEAEAIELYFRPGLGHVRLVDLTDQRIRDLYLAMRRINRPDEADETSELLHRLLAARAAREGHRVSTRPLSDARIKRMHAVLSAALNDAVKVDKILTDNPAAGVFRVRKGGRKGRARPRLWTAERVESWEETGEIPAKVMVWTATQCGNFLDFAEAAGERLYPLFHLAAYWGMRRGELVGLERPDLGLETRRLDVRQAQVDDELDDTKTENSDRQIIFDAETARVLTAWQQRQRFEQRQWAEAYTDAGRVFSYEDGRSLRPEYVSQRFDVLLTRYAAIRRRAADGWAPERIARKHRVPIEAVTIALSAPLPPVRFHDLRHGAATMLIASGAPDKVVSDVLGHASSAFTHDVYAVVAEELAKRVAADLAAIVPRRNRAMAAGAINVPSSPENGSGNDEGSPRNVRELPGQERRLGDLNPGWTSSPNRISRPLPPVDGDGS